MLEFNPNEFKKLYNPPQGSVKGDNGQVTIVGGSKLFHGAPLFALTTAARIVDMVFFASPEPTVGEVANQVKSQLFSFIWVPWEDLDRYIEKSDAVLIGPGFMRYRSEKDAKRAAPNPSDSEYQESREITRDLLLKFPDKPWVIDAGSLQVLDPTWIPKMAVLTPNAKEYKMLFGNIDPQTAAKKYHCVIVMKGHQTVVYSPETAIEVNGGTTGLTKGGTGDIESGLTAAILAKNDPLVAACAATYVVKKSADLLSKKVGTFFSSDDLCSKVPEVLKSLI